MLAGSAIFAILQLMGLVRTNFPKEFVLIQLIASIGFIIGVTVYVVRHSLTWSMDLLLLFMFVLLFYGLFKYRRKSKISTNQLWVIAGGAIIVSIMTLLTTQL